MPTTDELLNGPPADSIVAILDVHQVGGGGFDLTPDKTWMDECCCGAPLPGGLLAHQAAEIRKIFTTAYVVTKGDYSAYQVVRVYLDRAEADKVVAERNAVSDDYPWDPPWRVEERPIGAGAPFDGRVWQGVWYRYPANHFSIPPKPASQEWTYAREDETHIWHTGEDPGKATVITNSRNLPSMGDKDPKLLVQHVRVIGTDPDYVNKVLTDTVAQVKAWMEGIS